MKIFERFLFGAILIAGIVCSAGFAEAIDFADPNLEANPGVIVANNSDSNISYSPSDQSGEPAEVKPSKPSIPDWLTTAIIFTACILIVGAVLKTHKCCCGRKKFP
ncbi:MAG: hypothetical protein ACYS8Z_07400 [Planctomycetota bacterium]|jgi:hypothetical protein